MTRSIMMLCSLLLCTVQSPAAPVRPADDGIVLATVPAGIAAGSPFRLAEQALAAEPGNRAAAVRFARLAIEEGRRRADPRFLGRAEAALSPWFDEPDPPADLRILRAVVAQAAHRFTAATRDLDAVLAQRPDDPEARLVRAGVRIVTGDLAGAAEDCRAVRPVGGFLPAVVCRARIAALSGRAEAAVVAIGRALALSPEGPQSRFAALVAAEAAAMAGRPEDALAILDEAAAGPGDVPLLITRAELLLDLGRPSEVLAALDAAGGAEVILLARTRAAMAVGDRRLAGWVADLEERFATARAVGNSVHRREEARFELSVRGDPAAALVLAEENWRVQKEPADARLLLEAALAAGDPRAARPVVDHLRTTGLADARLAPLVARIEGKTP